MTAKLYRTDVMLRYKSIHNSDQIEIDECPKEELNSCRIAIMTEILRVREGGIYMPVPIRVKGATIWPTPSKAFYYSRNP